MLNRKQQTELAMLDGSTVLEAVVMLVCVRALMKICFGPLLRWSLRPQPGLAPPLHPHLELRVRQAIAAASGLLPGQNKCLPNAIAGRCMLARRGIASVVQLGVGNPLGNMHAHAWLEAAEAIVTGASPLHTVTPIRRA